MTTYSELVSTVSCETLNSCVAAPVDTVELVTTIVDTKVNTNTEVATIGAGSTNAFVTSWDNL